MTCQNAYFVRESYSWCIAVGASISQVIEGELRVFGVYELHRLQNDFGFRSARNVPELSVYGYHVAIPVVAHFNRSALVF